MYNKVGIWSNTPLAFSEERMVAFEKHIQSRVRKLLALPTASK